MSSDKLTMRRGRRDYTILIAAVILTAVIYNVIASLAEQGKKPTVGSETGGLRLEEVVHAGNEFMDNGRYDLAIQQYERALAIDSLHPEIMVDLGACYHSVGQNEEASFQFRRALALEPKHPIALYNLGVVSMTIGDTAGAKSWWGKYLDVSTDTLQARVVREQLSKL